MDCWGWICFFSSAVCASHQPGQLFSLSRSLSRFSTCNPVSCLQCIRLNMSSHKVTAGQVYRSVRRRYTQSVMTQGSFGSLPPEHVSRQTNSPLFLFVWVFLVLFFQIWTIHMVSILPPCSGPDLQLGPLGSGTQCISVGCSPFSGVKRINWCRKRRSAL